MWLLGSSLFRIKTSIQDRALMDAKQCTISVNLHRLESTWNFGLCRCWYQVNLKLKLRTKVEQILVSILLNKFPAITFGKAVFDWNMFIKISFQLSTQTNSNLFGKLFQAKLPSILLFWINFPFLLFHLENWLQLL